MNKNTKIGIGIGIIALLFIAYKKGVFGGSEGGNGGSENETSEETLKSSMPPSVPIVNLTASSETPQVVELKTPPQFTEVVTASNLPTSAGTYQSFN